MSFPMLDLMVPPDDVILVIDPKVVKPSLEEIKLAFSFLDIDKSGQVSLANLKKRLGVFFPDMTAKEYKFLMNNRKELTIEDLSEFLAENEISDPDFDPIAEAFKVKNKGKNCLARALFLVEWIVVIITTAITDTISIDWQAYDHKGIGSIKKERLREVFDSYGLAGPNLSEEELDMIFRNADVDRDGSVTLEDFRALVAGQSKDSNDLTLHSSDNA